MRRAGVRTFTEGEAYEAERRRRALEERGARGDRLHARHPVRSDADDAAILAQACAPLFVVDSLSQHRETLMQVLG